MATSCEFDRLLTQTVPHILEKIFFSLDFKSYMNCLVASRSWNDLLRSESFQRKGKDVFCEDIQKKLQLAAEKGNVDIIRRFLSSFMVDERMEGISLNPGCRKWPQRSGPTPIR